MAEIYDLLIARWRVQDGFLRPPDVIAVVSYGTFADRLTDGTLAMLRETVRRFREYPKSLIVFASFEYAPGMAGIESSLKKKFLQQKWIPEDAIIDAGSLCNSIQEARSIKKTLEERGIAAGHILVITGAGHSRSARYIWRRIFAETEVSVRGISYLEEIEQNHPMIFLRNRWSWLLVNVFRHLLLRTLGLEITNLFHQPTNNAQAAR